MSLAEISLAEMSLAKMSLTKIFWPKTTVANCETAGNPGLKSVN